MGIIGFDHNLHHCETGLSPLSSSITIIIMVVMVKLDYDHYPKLMMIMGIIQAAGEAQIIYPDLSCFLQIGGKYESQLIDLDFPGLEKHFHICTKSTTRSFASRFLPFLPGL